MSISTGTEEVAARNHHLGFLFEEIDEVSASKAEDTAIDPREIRCLRLVDLDTGDVREKHVAGNLEIAPDVIEQFGDPRTAITKGGLHRNLPEKTSSKVEILCAGWRGNPTLSESMTIEKYLKLPHLQISSDGLAEGIADRALAKMGLKRTVVATVPHYLVAPWILKGTDMLTVFGDSILPLLDDRSETLVFDPPFSLPDISVTMYYNKTAEDDPGHQWLRSLVCRFAEEQSTAKSAVRGG
jgi:hypothetical protein